jgi:hypothetical protein
MYHRDTIYDTIFTERNTKNGLVKLARLATTPLRVGAPHYPNEALAVAVVHNGNVVLCTEYDPIQIAPNGLPVNSLIEQFTLPIGDAATLALYNTAQSPITEIIVFTSKGNADASVINSSTYNGVRPAHYPIQAMPVGTFMETVVGSMPYIRIERM